MGNKNSSDNGGNKSNQNISEEDDDDVYYLEDGEIVNDSINPQSKNSHKIKISNNILINKLKTNPLSEYTTST